MPLDPGRHATIDRRLQQRLADLDLARAIIHGASDVDGQLGAPVQSTQHGDVEERAVLALESGARPDAAPAGFGHELLHGTGEVAGAGGEGGVDLCGGRGFGCELSGEMRGMRGMRRSLVGDLIFGSE